MNDGLIKLSALHLAMQQLFIYNEDNRRVF